MMDEAAYIEAVSTLLIKKGMNWHRPAGFDNKSRYFTNAAQRVFAIYIIQPEHLTPEERLVALAALHDILK